MTISIPSSPSDKPIIFAFHGYPWLIHRLTYRRTNHDNLHVRGYKEEGTTTTPFDMTVLNDLDRFHLAGDVIDRVPRLRNTGAHFKQFLRNKLIEHKLYIEPLRRRHAGDPRLAVASLKQAAGFRAPAPPAASGRTAAPGASRPAWGMPATRGSTSPARH